VALLRQARPDLGPSAVAGVLRATGKPLTDPRNSVTTPRVDTLASVEAAAGAFAAYVGPAAAIPDGTGEATVTVTVSGFSGVVAGVQAWVEIDHNSPEQLRLTLTGPDGTSAVLQDETGQPEHPINAIYGKTDATAQSLAVFQGRPPNGVWTLTVEDRVAGAAGRIRNFSITLVAAPPSSPIPVGVSAAVLPVVAHVFGTKLFFSDLRIFNPGPSAKTFSLYFVPAGQDGSSAVRVLQSVDPGHVLALDDVITSQFGYEDTIGPMTIVGSDRGFLATSRAFTRGDNGTFGLFVPSFGAEAGLSLGGGTATANGLAKSPQFHSNVGFTEVSGAPATVRIDLRDQAGSLLASTTRSTNANTTFLITDVIREEGLPDVASFRADFTVVSATGRVVPFATYVDDVTGDGSFQSASVAAASAEDVVVAQSAHVTGANGDFFKTNLDISNLGGTPVTLTVSLIPLLTTGTPAGPRVYVLAPGQTLEKADVLASEFGLSDPSAAGLRIHPDRPARLAVSTRTYVEKFGGTFGYSVPGVPAATGVGAGAIATAIQLDQTTGLSGYRSNFGFTEVAGAPVNVQVTVFSGDTGAVLGSRVYSVAANASFQASVGDILGMAATATNLYLQFAVQSGGGRVVPYATAVDNKSGDAIYMPAQ
jgi:subtilisin-like proprotein convertase family protein